MTKAATGDAVKVECKVNPSSPLEQDPGDRLQLEFTIGENRLIPGLEKAVVGMQPGETKTERIPACEAFGERRPELVFPVSSSLIAEGLEPEVGQEIAVEYSDGKSCPARVAEVADEEVVVDANHPLAGKDLVLEISLVAFAG